MNYGRPIIDDKYILEKEIGYGGSSIVFKGESTEGFFAIKVIRKDKEFSKSSEEEIIKKECHIMETVGYHCNILSLRDYNLRAKAYSTNQIKDISYLSYEFGPNGNLFEIIQKTGPLPEDLVKFYFSQLGSAVKHMHDKRVAHLDIKPANILLDEYFNLKLADFGGSVFLDSFDTKTNQRFGTKGYMAPEIIEPALYDPFKADVYSLAATLYFLVTGQILKEDSLKDNLFKDSTHSDEKSVSTGESNQNFSSDAGIPSATSVICSKSSKNSFDAILALMLSPSPLNRPGIDEVIHHPWLNLDLNENSLAEYYTEMNLRRQSIA